MSEPVSSWIGTAVTAVIAIVAGAWVLIRRLLSTVTREELSELIKGIGDRNEKVMRELEIRQEKKMDELENRQEKKMDELRGTLLFLHEDNKLARHNLSDRLSRPVNNLSAEIVRLRQSLGRSNPPDIEGS